MLSLDDQLKAAQIAELNARTAEQEAHARKLDGYFTEQMAITAKLNAETQRLAAETAKINTENRFYPYVVAGGFGGLIGAAVSLAIKFL